MLALEALWRGLSTVKISSEGESARTAFRTWGPVTQLSLPTRRPAKAPGVMVAAETCKARVDQSSDSTLLYLDVPTD